MLLVERVDDAYVEFIKANETKEKGFPNEKRGTLVLLFEIYAGD